MREMKFYGTPLPGVELEPYSGKLIVIEGADGALLAWLLDMGGQ